VVSRNSTIGTAGSLEGRTVGRCPRRVGVELIADGGAFIGTTTLGPTDAGRGVRTTRIFVRSDTDQLAELVARVDAGDLKIHVAARRP